eukprot:5355369-Pyramimonas_sp.AAC.1
MLSRRAVLAQNVSLYVDCAATVGCLRHLTGAAGASSARADWRAEIGDRLDGIQVFKSSRTPRWLMWEKDAPRTCTDLGILRPTDSRRRGPSNSVPP